MTKKEKKEDGLNNGEVSEEIDSSDEINFEEELVETSGEQTEESPGDLIKDLEDQSLAKEFLSVGDNIDRAIASCEEGEEITNIKEGLELTMKAYESSLKSSGIEPIECDGKSFDSEKHEALSMIEDDNLESNSIIEVIQKGYSILDRTLRPSKVIVSKKSEEK